MAYCTTPWRTSARSWPSTWSTQASTAGVLDAAGEAGAPVVVQLSVRSARQWGIEAALACHTKASGARSCPVHHLEHCADREFATACLLRAGWDSVLFDASGPTYESALRQTAELVESAREYGGAWTASSRQFPASARAGTRAVRRRRARPSANSPASIRWERSALPSAGCGGLM
ncbi:class II fructose-bisphosphate aldolase [Streptomyces sp. NPDC054837]